MSNSELLINYWYFNWTTIFIAVALTIFQLLTNRKGPKQKNFLFFIGVIVLLLVTISPLSYLGMRYLFSAHMIEHIVLLLIVPPFLLAGTNKNLLQRLQNSSFRKVGNTLFSVPVAWIIGVGSMYFWHIPQLFDAMKKSAALHSVHVVSLLLAGVIFIWPVYSPISWKRLTPLQSALYLFIACVGCTILGILITFGSPSLYIPYFTGDSAAIWSLIRDSWGITASIDQQAAGLIMWVPACIIYITNIMLILAGYYRQTDVDDDQD